MRKIIRIRQLKRIQNSKKTNKNSKTTNNNNKTNNKNSHENNKPMVKSYFVLHMQHANMRNNASMFF